MMKELQLYRHTLFFASNLAAETAEMIVPSHVEHFVNSAINPSSAFQSHAYTFLTHGALSDISCQDIMKLAYAQSSRMNMRH